MVSRLLLFVYFDMKTSIGSFDDIKSALWENAQDVKAHGERERAEVEYFNISLSRSMALARQPQCTPWDVTLPL